MSEGFKAGRDNFTVPKGLIQYEDSPHFVLSKPILIPLKPVNLKKLEQMQKEIQKKVKHQDNLQH